MLYLWLTWLFSPVLRLVAGRAPAEPQRILVIQMAKIGDLLCATPVFREIKNRYPSAHLTVMATAQNAPLLLANPRIDAVRVTDAKAIHGLVGKWRLTRLLRVEHYDTVVCLNASAAFAVATLWAGIPRRLAVQSNFGGASHRLSARLWSAVEPHYGDRLIQETYLALLARLGINAKRMDKEVFPAAGSAQKVAALLGASTAPLIGIGVSSANRLKALGSKKISEVALRLLSARPALRLVLIGGSVDAEQANEIARQLPLNSVINACGALGLAELPVLLTRLSLFIGVDSGITYMADALSVPLVTVAGPCNMQETRPLGKNAIILQRTELPCVPCAHIFNAPYTCRIGTRACIEGISAVEIAEAALALLGHDVQ